MRTPTCLSSCAEAGAQTRSSAVLRLHSFPSLVLMFYALFSAVLLRAQGVGTIVTVAGNGIAGFSGDGGQSTNASLNLMQNVVVARDGTLFIADWQNHRIRKVSPTGIISTAAGTGTAGFSGDGG